MIINPRDEQVYVPEGHVGFWLEHKYSDVDFPTIKNCPCFARSFHTVSNEMLRRNLHEYLKEKIDSEIVSNPSVKRTGPTPKPPNGLPKDEVWPAPVNYTFTIQLPEDIYYLFKNHNNKNVVTYKNNITIAELLKHNNTVFVQWNGSVIDEENVKKVAMEFCKNHEEKRKKEDMAPRELLDDSSSIRVF